MAMIDVTAVNVALSDIALDLAIPLHGPGLGGRRLHPDVCRAAAGRRRAGRPLRAESRVPGRPGRFHARLDVVRRRARRPFPDGGAPAAGRGRGPVHAQFTEPADAQL